MSIFDEVPLLSPASIHPITATFAERLRADHPLAATMRTRINTWVEEDVPPARRAEVAGRLLSERDLVGAEATFFELLTGRILWTLFGQARWEPDDLPVNGRPDWSTHCAGSMVVFETRTLEEDIPEAERRGIALFHRLSEIIAPWFVMVHWDECEGLENARVRILTSRIHRELNGLAPGTGPHEITVGHLATTIRLTAVPMARAHSVIQTRTRSVWSPGVNAIRTAVKKKGSKYAGLKPAGIPYVVVVCTSDPLTDYDSLCTALFGELVARVALPPGGALVVAQPVLNKNGCLTPDPGQPPPFTRISAVWLAKCHFDAEGWRVELTCAPNPWATNPFDWNDPRVATITHTLDALGTVEFDVPLIQPSFWVT